MKIKPAITPNMISCLFTFQAVLRLTTVNYSDIMIIQINQLNIFLDISCSILSS